MRICASIFLILCMLPFPGAAQQEYVFNRISTEDGFGLASNMVTSLYQDPKGFMWVGTNNGLQRYDGGKFISFKSRGADPLPYNQVSNIIPMGDGKLMLGFITIREFGIFDPVTLNYQKIKLHTSKPVWARAAYFLWKDSHGEIYMSVGRYGLMHYDRTKNSFEDDRHFNLPAGYTPAIYGLFEDTFKQQYWISCDQGLVVYDSKSRQTWWAANNPRQLPLLNIPALHDHPQFTFIDRQRRTWVFAWPDTSAQKIFCLDSTGRMLTADTLGLSTGSVKYKEYHMVTQTREGNIWVHGLGILANYDNITRRFIHNKSNAATPAINSIVYDRINVLMEDRDGSIWLATNRGLYISPKTSGSFTIVNYLFSEPDQEVSDVWQDKKGNYWFACWGAGLKVLDKNFKEIPVPIYNDPPPATWPEHQKIARKMAWTICENSMTGQYMIGCNAGVLVLYDPVKEKTTYLLPEELEHSSIRQVMQDRNGTVWLGTQNGRLVKWVDGKFSLVAKLGSIIYRILQDKQGLLWVAVHENGVYAIDPNTGKTMAHYTAGKGPGNLYNNTPMSLEELNDSIIVAGAGALNFINKRTQQVRKLRYEDGLPSNNVERLQKDNLGFLWIITSEGLCRYNPFKNKITSYGRRDGIALAGVTNKTDLLTQNGNVMFAGENGMIAFDPMAFNAVQRPPDVSITDFKIFNDFIPVDSLLKLNEIRLSPDQNSFSLYFAALSYLHRDKLTYYYKLEGIDKDWRTDYVSFQNYAVLPPGRYTFKAFCENTEGLRSANITAISIVVRPPFWKTKWFISLILFSIALLIYAWHNSRVKQLLAVEHIRSRVARDLHDDMGSTLSTINILSTMAKTRMGTDTVKTSEYLGKITDNSQRMMEAMDDIVWSIKPSNDSLQKIAARMREFATNVLEAKDIHFVFKVQEDVLDLKLDMAARADLFLVFKEAVNNAAKYSRATTLEAYLEIVQKKLLLTVKDDGTGFIESESDNGNGLSNMKKRAESLNGILHITSAPGKGCVVKLSIPVK